MGSVIPLKKSANSAYLELKNLLGNKLEKVESLIELKLKSDVKLLEKFLSDRGKIRSSLITGITKQEQAKIARLVKIGRELALLPYVTTSSYKQSYNRR